MPIKKPLLSLALLLVVSSHPSAQQAETLKGYAEWRQGDAIIVDGQRVRADAATKVTVKRKGAVETFAAIPLGDEVSAKGLRQPNGSVLAKEIEAKPNGPGLFEAEIRQATNDLEKQWVESGAAFEEEEDENGKVTRKEIGKILSAGPEVERSRAILNRVAPGYVDANNLRLYVIANKDWNAMAMANGAIWMFKGALDDMDDDEVAIILGHELAHVTHEHSRQAFRKSMWALLVIGGVWVAADQIDDKTARTIVQIAGVVAPLVWVNKYNRVQEDQADRVGLRYAFEAGYDPRKGPRLWERFLKKYGEGNRVVNFLIGDHSTAKARIANMERQLALNYGGALKPKSMRRASPQAGAKSFSGPAAGAQNTIVVPGMSEVAVQRILGEPDERATTANEVRWTYDDIVVIFTNGRVSNVEFVP